jgi:putative hydrolase of the HAD superfamily
MIKLVGFDLDDCLFNSTGLSKRARIKGIDAMRNLGLKIEREKAIQILMEICVEYGSNFSFHYDLFIRRLNEVEGGYNIPYNLRDKYVAAAVMAYHKEKIDSIKLYDDVKNCLIKLKESNVKTAIISDGLPKKQYEKILRLNIDDLIDLVVISDQFGVRKPNPKLFEFCLSKFGVEGKETIYIGDRLEKDVLPARKNGIHTVYIHRGGKYDFSKPDIEKPIDIKPDFEIDNLSEIFPIIKKLNM